MIMTREEIYSRFEELDKRASLGGGVDKIEKQHAQGKMTARERIGMLLDKGTFNELDKLVNHRCTNFGMEKKQIAGDGMVTGYGKIDGRPVFVYAYDFTAHGGSLSETNAAKIVKVQQLALKTGAPVIALNDSGGARIQEGVNSLAGYASIFYQNTIASGVIPQISAILGPCAGGACYSPALTDFIFMVKEKSHMFITGPDVVKTVTNEEVGKEELGGAYTHSSKSGVTHFMCDNEEETLMSIRELLSFLPSNNMEDAPLVPCNDDIHRQVEALQTVIPEDPNMPYDIKDIIEPVLDNQYFFEVMPHFAKNVVVGFGRLGGRSVGIVANQPAWLAGVLDIDASDKAARFIRFCDCFNIPLITFEDVPGFLPGTIQEHNGIIRHGAKIVYAYAEVQGRRRPVAVMLSNIISACPQSGISRAGVIYEAPVEGGITRLMGLFENYDDLEKIGSVRSCREYYVYLAAGFDALYYHYGQAAYAIPLLESDHIDNVNGMEYSEQVYYRTSDRPSPHNAYLDAAGIAAGIDLCGYRTSYKDGYDGFFQFASETEPETLEQGRNAAYVAPGGYFHNNPWFSYDEASGTYLRYQFGEPQIDEMTQEQLAVKNIIVQYCSWKKYDDNAEYLDIDVVNGGTGTYITSGKAIDVTWSKDDPWGVTKYRDSNGEEIKLNLGKTWVLIVLDNYADETEIR